MKKNQRVIVFCRTFITTFSPYLPCTIFRESITRKLLFGNNDYKNLETKLPQKPASVTLVILRQYLYLSLILFPIEQDSEFRMFTKPLK